jgi:ATP-dependent Clp protease protease subunit
MEAAIRFLSPVDQYSTNQLFGSIDQLLGDGFTKIRLLLSTPGGSVFHGLSVYNYLKGLPIEIDTYNFGSVDSIGVVIFSAGTNRFSVPHSRFLIHSVKFSTQGPISADEKQLDEFLKSLKIDQKNIAKVIADTCSKTEEDVDNDMNNRTTLTPEQAKNYGLVTGVKSELLVSGMRVITIGETVPGHMNIPNNMVIPNFNSISESNLNSFTENISINIGTI